MKTVHFQILIPVYNAADVIDETMQSIWQQRYDRENIYIFLVDFGSTDGTYQKILGYDPFHMGIYQVDKDFTEGRMAAETARTVPYSGSRVTILLWPGDVIYPDSLDRVAQAVKRHRHRGLIISETDVKAQDGSVTRLPAFHEKRKIIDGKKEYAEFLIRGYQHHVMSFGGEISQSLNFINGQINERIWWSKSCSTNFERETLYIPEYLGCVRERYYRDELQEIMFRWNVVLDYRRNYEYKFKRKPEKNDLAEENLAHYTLWRSWLLENRGDFRQAKECFLFSTVICPPIRETEIYRWLEKYVLEKDRGTFSHIQAFFQNDELS